MYYTSKRIHSIAGKWVIQKTIYNFLSNQVLSTKSNSFLKPVTYNIPLPNLYLENKNYYDIIHLGLNSQDNQPYCNTYIALLPQFTSQNSNLTNIIILQNSNFVKKCYYANFKCISIIQSQYLKFLITEKSWSVSQNLILSISTISYDTSIIAMIFESKIRS